MTTVRDPVRGVLAPVLPCRVCQKPVYFGWTAKGKRNPYDVDEEGEPTRVSHFTTCAEVRTWTAAHPKPKGVGT